LALFEVLGAPPKKDITKFIPPASFTGVNDGFLIMKRPNGDMYTKNLTNIMPTWSPPNCGTADCAVLTYTCKAVTDFGECGAMLVIDPPRGPIVAGFHAYAYLKNGEPTEIGISIALTQEYLESISELLDQDGLGLGDIEPAEIALDLKEGDRVVGPLHHKSVVSYCETGSASVYGTLSGMRPMPRSKVTSTPLREVVEQKFERESTFGPPVMKGWNCWRKNILPVVDRTATYDKSVLVKARDCFVSDIIAALDEQDSTWVDELHPLDDYSTVNGLMVFNLLML
jgi:hypothetical protein